MRGRWPRRLPRLLVPLLLFIGWSQARAQVFPPSDPVSQADSLLPSGVRYSEAVALLEKTLFRIDVALLRVRFGAETTAELASILNAGGSSSALSESALSDSVAGVAIRSRNAWITMTFLRDVGFGRFLDGVRDGVTTARDAGVIDRSFASELLDSMPRWYASLETRGVFEGDVMTYRIRGDTLRTRFRSKEGTILLDQVDVGSQAPPSVLGSFFSPGSDFRERLLASVMSGGVRR